MVDRLTMCHTLDFRPSFGRLPFTVDAVDVLLSKLQIVELNEKDARDIVHLLSGAAGRRRAPRPADRHRPVRQGARRGLGLVADGHRQPGQAARAAGREPRAGSARAAGTTRWRRRGSCCELAESAPKGVKWKLRANVGDRVRWYELPEEVDH